MPQAPPSDLRLVGTVVVRDRVGIYALQPTHRCADVVEVLQAILLLKVPGEEPGM
jgi:hypothetical protein